MLATLLRYRSKELRHRVASARLGVVLGLGVAGGLAAALVLAGDAVAGAPGTPTTVLAEAAFSRTFWINALLAFVLGFTTFEALFRSEAGRRLEALPVSPRALFGERVVSLALLHAPLLAAALLFAAPLATRDPALFLHALVVHGGTFAFGLAAAIALHVFAGHSLLSGARWWKEFLGNGFHTNEATMLLYSPAAAFGVAVFTAVPLDLLARELVLHDTARPALTGLGLLALLGAGALAHATRVYRRSWSLVRARFNEAELLRPWREDDVTQRVMGDVLLRWLRPPLAGLYRANLLQLRRRHRVDMPLLVAATIALVVFHVATPLAPAVLLRIDAAALALAVGVLLSPVYKLTGHELEPEGLARVLPVPPGLVRRAKALVALTHQAPLALVVAGAYGVTAAAPLTAMLLFVGGTLGGLGLSLAYLRLAAAAHRPGLAWTFRGAVAALALVIGGVA